MEEKGMFTPVLDSISESKEQGKQWAKNKGATEEFINLADIYWTLSQKRGGVNPIVAYCQAALETGYGKFGGVLTSDFKNPCGLKNTDGTNDLQASHARFNSWNDGVEAHLDHLALYAGAQGYPNKDSKDPRHFTYLLGIAKNVEELSGHWSPTEDYGEKILKLMVELSNTVSKDFKEEEVKIVVDEGNIIDKVKNLQVKFNEINKSIEELNEKYLEVSLLVKGLSIEMDALENDKKYLVNINSELKAKALKNEQVIEGILNIINTK